MQHLTVYLLGVFNDEMIANPNRREMHVGRVSTSGCGC